MRLIFISLFFFVAQIAAFGQMVSGEITDEDLKPLPYVNVGVVGFDRGTISSSDGRFTIDVSGLNEEETVRFSSIGYENIDMSVGEISSGQKTLSLIMEKKIYGLQEVVVLPENEKSFTIGQRKTSWFAWVGDDVVRGAEIGKIFRSQDKVFLKSFSFHIKRSFCENIQYRLKMYSVENDYPDSLINEKEILFSVGKEKGWKTVDLSKYGFTLEGDFIVSMEIVDGSCEGDHKKVHISFAKDMDKDYSIFYSRPSSMAPWLEVANDLAFAVEVYKY